MARPPSRSRMAYYAQLSQVGVQMAAPIGLGALFDSWWELAPWCTIVGAVMGLIVGLVQLVRLGNREESIPEDDTEEQENGAAP